MGRTKRRNSNNVLLRLLTKALGILLIIGIPALLFINTFSLKDVQVVGCEKTTKEQITNMLVKTKTDKFSLLLYLKYEYFVSPKIPFVEKIDVEMVNNHSVQIQVYEKMVTGCIEFMEEYLYFDKDGIIVESSSKQLERIPVIKGLQFNKIILYEKLEVQKEELFNVILDLTRQIEKYDLDVDTISFNSRYEVTIYCGDIKVLLGKRNVYDEVLSELKNILDKAEGKSIEIDMSRFEKGTDRIIAKPKKSTD